MCHKDKLDFFLILSTEIDCYFVQMHNKLYLSAIKSFSPGVYIYNKGIKWLFEGILFICARVVSFVARARSARAANDSTRARINNTPKKSFYYHFYQYTRPNTCNARVYNKLRWQGALFASSSCAFTSSLLPA